VGGGALKAKTIGSLPGDIGRARRGGAFAPSDSAAAAVIVRAVRRDGDEAVLRIVRRFDRAGAGPRDLVLNAAAIRRVARACSLETRGALDFAYARIRAFHERQRARESHLRDRSADLRLVPSPLDRVGALVPRGIAAYPSTALMTGVPAQIAGVRELVVASPMPRDGSVDPALAYALQLVDATTLYRAGGAAAVAALAYGTASLGQVDKIVGPGNAYATAAKWLVSADVGIDALQGPSELIVVASGDADARVLALDLLAQAEHGAGSFAALVSDDAALLRAVDTALATRRKARVFVYRARNLLAAVRAADDAAPEHILLAGRGAAALAADVRHAGAVFIGTRSAVAFGDYVAGTNHSLPTGGTARWASALRVEDFVRWTSRVSLRGDLTRLASAGALIAGHEGMRYHKASMEARL
jgi:histidinol dehydrogenase